MVYIFSNVFKHSSKEEFVKILSNYNFKDPKFVFLNTAVPFHNGIDFFKDKTNYCLCTQNEGQFFKDKIKTDDDNYKIENYFGLSEIEKCSAMFKEIFTRYSETLVLKLLNKTLAYEKGSFKEAIDKAHLYIHTIYPNKTLFATTGFSAYFTFKEYLNDDVALVNFYGSKDNSTCHWEGHNWNFEEEYLDKTHALKIFI